MKTAWKFSPLTHLLFMVVGAGVALLLQTYRSNTGLPPFSPPVSLPATLIVMAGVLFWLSVRLRKVLSEKTEQQVNPFHAVRLLAAAHASQLSGMLFSGFGLGLLLTLLNRPVGVALSVWLPMLLTIICALVLFFAGLYAEHSCRVPPEDEDEAKQYGEEPEAEPGQSPA